MLADIPSTHLPIWEAAMRLGAALLFAGIIGWEREVKGRSAGLRTHMLVALGAAGYSLLGAEYIASSQRGFRGPDASDLGRVIQAVATGVGFLGAGAIIQSGARVKGLTTAASIWTVSAIGVACGTGFWSIAFMLTVMALMTLTLLRWLEPPPDGSTDQL